MAWSLLADEVYTSWVECSLPYSPARYCSVVDNHIQMLHVALGKYFHLRKPLCSHPAAKLGLVWAESIQSQTCILAPTSRNGNA